MLLSSRRNSDGTEACSETASADLVWRMRRCSVSLEDIKKIPPDFPKAKRLYVALGDELDRLRQWFQAVYGKAELADDVAVWGAPEHIADQIVRLKNARVDHVLLNPVF